MVRLYKHRYTHFPRKTFNISDSFQILWFCPVHLKAKVKSSLIFLHKNMKERINIYCLYVLIDTPVNDNK